MTADDELRSRQAAEDARPTADATYTSGLIRNIARGMTAAEAAAIARDQLRRRQDAWGQAISDSMAQLAAAGAEAFTVPGISGYVYQQFATRPTLEEYIQGQLRNRLATKAYRLDTDVEQLVVDEIEHWAGGAASVHEADKIRASARRIIAIVQHHNP